MFNNVRETIDISDSKFYHKVNIGNRKNYNFNSI